MPYSKRIAKSWTHGKLVGCSNTRVEEDPHYLHLFRRTFAQLSGWSWREACVIRTSNRGKKDEAFNIWILARACGCMQSKVKAVCIRLITFSYPGLLLRYVDSRHAITACLLLPSTFRVPRTAFMKLWRLVEVNYVSPSPMQSVELHASYIAMVTSIQCVRDPSVSLDQERRGWSSDTYPEIKGICSVWKGWISIIYIYILTLYVEQLCSTVEIHLVWNIILAEWKTEVLVRCSYYISGVALISSHSYVQKPPLAQDSSVSLVVTCLSRRDFARETNRKWQLGMVRKLNFRGCSSPS